MIEVSVVITTICLWVSLLLVSVALLLLKPAVCCLRSVMVVNTRSAWVWDHVARKCLFDQMFFARDMMKDVRILNAKLARGRIHITVDCAADRCSLPRL